MHEFPPEVIEFLDYYVYRLIDPRNGQTFYVGKGRGNRIFSHVQNQLNGKSDQQEDDKISLKLKTIAEIRSSGLEVNHVIHRHGMDEHTAFEVEAALIEAYPGLANIAGGHNNFERGCAHVNELVIQYKAEEASIDEQLIAININQSLYERNDIYEAARFCWKIAEWRRKKLNIPIVACVNRIIRDVYIVSEWLPATDLVFDEIRKKIGEANIENRWGFVKNDHPSLKDLLEDLQQKYKGKRLPKQCRSYGSPLLFLGPDWELKV
jgi:hypothetical protein